MTRTTRSKSAPRLGVVDQVVLAVHSRNRLASALGFVAGGVVPIATYLEAHYDLDPAQGIYSQLTSYLVLGGLVFSAKTVFTWAQRAFHDAWKAAGFVVLLEGVMITSSVPVLPFVLLAILVAVNGIATGCTLSLDRSRSRPEATPIKPKGNVVAISNTRAAAMRTAAAATPAVARSRRALRNMSEQERFTFEPKSVVG